MCWQAIDQGASGVDMGRNIFQSDHPVAMMKAVQAVVHHNETADRAYELYLSENSNCGFKEKNYARHTG